MFPILTLKLAQSDSGELELTREQGWAYCSGIQMCGDVLMRCYSYSYLSGVVLVLVEEGLPPVLYTGLYVMRSSS